MNTATAEALKAIAVVVGAVAWPIVAAVGMFIFRPQLRNLLNRLREGGGAKFDPFPQGQEVGATLLTTGTATGIGSTVPFVRTASITRWEQTVRDNPQLKALTNPAQREEFLINSMAGLLVLVQFEVAESSMPANSHSFSTCRSSPRASPKTRSPSCSTSLRSRGFLRCMPIPRWTLGSGSCRAACLSWR